jgi:hypothetical protein
MHTRTLDFPFPACMLADVGGVGVRGGARVRAATADASLQQLLHLSSGTVTLAALHAGIGGGAALLALPAEHARYGVVYRSRAVQRGGGGGGGAGSLGADSGKGAAGNASGKQAGGSSTRGRFSRRSRQSGSVAVVGGGSGAARVGGTAAAQAALEARAHPAYLFKHVRFNRMHVRLTYEGPPLGVRDFRVVRIEFLVRCCCGFTAVGCCANAHCLCVHLYQGSWKQAHAKRVVHACRLRHTSQHT